MSQIIATYAGTIDIKVSRRANINFSGFTNQTLQECFEKTCNKLGIDPNEHVITGVVVEKGYPNPTLKKIVFQKGKQVLVPQMELIHHGFNNTRTDDGAGIFIKAI